MFAIADPSVVRKNWKFYGDEKKENTLQWVTDTLACDKITKARNS